MTPIQMKQFYNDVEHVLHVPGNLAGSHLSEMAVILDYKLSLEQLKSISADMAAVLKRKGDVFRNIRLNVVKWISDEQIITQNVPLSLLGIGRGFEDYDKMSHTSDKNIEVLAGRLKLFHARSKLMILISDGRWQVKSQEELQQNLQPFLHKKWIWLDANGNSKGRVSHFMDF